MSTTTFSLLHLAPEGRAMLACSCLVPDGWANVPIPEDTYDFENPSVFLPLLVCMAPYGAVMFTIAARPAFDDGTVQDWAEYLAGQNNLTVERIRQARVNRMPCVLVDATMASEVGVMRSRSVFLEDGRRLFNIGTLAPQAIWPSVEADFDRLLGSFELDDVQGLTAVPLRLMTSESAVDLSALAAEAAARSVSPEPVTSESPSTSEKEVTQSVDVEPAVVSSDDRPTQADDGKRTLVPDWWRDAMLLERADRIADAEQMIEKALDHIGVYSSLAHLHELRYERLLREGRQEAAAAARERAIHWLFVYASSATSGGEGAALSLERDQRIKALGGQVPR